MSVKAAVQRLQKVVSSPSDQLQKVVSSPSDHRPMLSNPEDDCFDSGESPSEVELGGQFILLGHEHQLPFKESPVIPSRDRDILEESVEIRRRVAALLENTSNSEDFLRLKTSEKSPAQNSQDWGAASVARFREWLSTSKLNLDDKNATPQSLFPFAGSSAEEASSSGQRSSSTWMISGDGGRDKWWQEDGLSEGQAYLREQRLALQQQQQTLSLPLSTSGTEDRKFWLHQQQQPIPDASSGLLSEPTEGQVYLEELRKVLGAATAILEK